MTKAKTTTLEKDHGRIEKREYYLETDIGWMIQKDDWKGLSAIGAVRSAVIKKDSTCTETRYFLTSLTDVNRFVSDLQY